MALSNIKVNDSSVRIDEGPFNISLYNAVELNNPSTYSSLTEALSALPIYAQQGGMSVKYVDTSSNIYQEYRLCSSTYNTITDNWQCMNSEGVFDVSEYNASGGSYSTYTDLADLLTNHLADIPAERRKGGMSIKFVQSSDNKYVQYRLMNTSWSINTEDWQGVDNEPIAGSDNLVKSSGVFNFTTERTDDLLNKVGSFASERIYTAQNDGINMVWDGNSIVETSNFKSFVVLFPEKCRVNYEVIQGTILVPRTFSSYPKVGNTDIVGYIPGSGINDSENLLYILFQFYSRDQDEPFEIKVNLSYCGLMKNQLITYPSYFVSNDKIISIEELGNAAVDGIRVTIPSGPIYTTNGIEKVQLSSPQELTLTGGLIYYLFIKNGQFYLKKTGENIYFGGSDTGLVAIICPKTKYPVSGLYVYKYNNVIYKPFTESVLDSIREDISELNSIVTDIEILENPIKGLSFPTSVASNVKNAIKKIWIVTHNDSDYLKIIEHCNNRLYLSVINNIPAAFAPYVGISSVTGSDNQIFVWYLRNQTEPRTGVETIYTITPGNIKTEFGLDAYAYIYITIDWDSIGENVKYQNIDAPIILNIMNRIEPSLNKLSFDNVKPQLISSSLSGKNIVCFGDSLTEMVDLTYSKHYSDYIADMTGANMINVGIGGSQLRRRAGIPIIKVFDETKSYSTDSICIYIDENNNTAKIYKFTSNHTGAWDYNDVEEYSWQSVAYANLDVISLIQASCEQDFADILAACEVVKQTQSDDNTAIINRLVAIDWTKVDAITIFAGTNDWYNANTLGATGSTDPNKTLGAINEIVRMFLTAYPHIKIYWFTPVVRWRSGFNLNTTPPTIDDAEFGDNCSVEGNGTLKEECAAIIQEVTKNHIPVCDMYNNFGWNKYNCVEFFSGTDGTHPKTQKGVIYLANKILNFLYANKTF